jgi:hypothetical protein
MDLLVEWDEPVELRHVESGNLIYECNLDLIPDAPGVYVFARRFDEKHYPLYIGKTHRLRTRVGQHFRTNVALMRGLEHADNGARVVMIGRFIAKRGQQLASALDVLERTYIKSAPAQECELLNVQGTKYKLDTITSTGARASYDPFPKRLTSKQR